MNELRAELQRIYQFHNVEKLAAVDALLDEWRGQEQQLLATIIIQSCMTMVDYAKFVDMLLAEGCAADGARVLTPQSVRELTYGRFTELDRQSKIAQAFSFDGRNGVFQLWLGSRTQDGQVATLQPLVWLCEQPRQSVRRGRRVRAGVPTVYGVDPC